ncbi:hypothetical protein [Polluticoccus soli]|uniref:hypothetical protein n=1 Tax=Polluticoccus soli TaxID=3034150 RepID=UPI0023E2933C|nr:hypothetical protein [Flavipsychrobacter sp. JY13-12]
MATKTMGQMASKVASNTEHREGPVARAIEEQTAKLPSDIFLWSSLGAMGVALVAKLMKRDHLALFIGQWAAPFLIMGLYDKVVKTHGHDKVDK